jgi:septal ring factor EnvC (AmiA/AmiB activator)
MRITTLALCLLWFSSPVVVMAQQSRTELEKQRQETLRELEEVNNTYNTVKKNKKESLGQLNLIQRKIRLRNQEIENINAQMRAVDDSMFLINREIYRLKGDLDTLKANYAKSLIYAYKNESSYDFLNFIFSATNFNDAVRRVEYLKSYRANREQQVTDILKTEGLITKQAKDFANTKVQKGEVLTNDGKARIKLEEEKKEKDDLVSGLKSQEKELSSTIANKHRQLQHLQLAINTVVRHEIEMARKEEAAKAEKEKVAEAEERKNAAAAAAAARNNAAPATQPSSRTPASSPGSNRPVTPVTAPVTATSEAPRSIHTSVLLDNDANIKLAANFEINRGRLPWPVSKGWIVAHYGKNTVEGTPIDYFNTSLTIGTDVGASVKVVFDGDIVSVADVGGTSAVIVKHGNYFTSYGNLSSVSVNKGDHVHTGQAIGQVAAGDSGNGQLEFILMKDLSPQNPENWLRPSAR